MFRKFYAAVKTFNALWLPSCSSLFTPPEKTHGSGNQIFHQGNPKRGVSFKIFKDTVWKSKILRGRWIKGNPPLSCFSQPPCLRGYPFYYPLMSAQSVSRSLTNWKESRHQGSFETKFATIGRRAACAPHRTPEDSRSVFSGLQTPRMHSLEAELKCRLYRVRISNIHHFLLNTQKISYNENMKYNGQEIKIKQSFTKLIKF